MMRKVLNGVRMDGVVVIGEGEKDEVRGSRVARNKKVTK
jgi:fructose-1,6-bisphosphatase/sedoheptulose 1,7-bisphosphatase-like protein